MLPIIIYDDIAQYYYCLDVLDDRDDPAIVTIEHDGSDPDEYQSTLSRFLSKMWLPR